MGVPEPHPAFATRCSISSLALSEMRSAKRRRACLSCAALSPPPRACSTPCVPRSMISSAPWKPWRETKPSRHRARLAGARWLRAKSLPLPARPVPSRSRKARQFLDAHFTRTVASEELEAVTGLTRYVLARHFRARLGTSPYRYLTMRRLDRAKSMIRAGDSLAEAAQASGFADQSHMTRHFGRAFGMSPGRWQALHVDSQRCMALFLGGNFALMIAITSSLGDRRERDRGKLRARLRPRRPARQHLFDRGPVALRRAPLALAPGRCRDTAHALAGSRATQEGVIVIQAQTHRSLKRNREAALARLVELIRRAAIPPRPRRPTKPTRAAKERRLASKARRSRVKTTRRVEPGEE